MKHKDKKEKKTKQFILSITIVIIMVSSVLGYFGLSNSDNQNTNNYNGFKIYQLQDNWILELNGNSIPFDYHPSQLEDIQLTKITPTNKVYLLFDPNEKDSNMEYSMNKLATTLRIIGISAFPACSIEQNCPDIPVKDCKSENTMFYFKKTEQLNLDYQDSCIIIGGNAIDSSKMVDRIRYALLGVMK